MTGPNPKSAPAAQDGLFRSPSGLLTKAAWEEEIESSYDVLPRWFRDEAERDRRFVRWVHDEARFLAARLDRMRRPDVPAARPLTSLSEALRTDAEWARRLIDRPDDPQSRLCGGAAKSGGLGAAA
jgi:hypothetical protein